MGSGVAINSIRVVFYDLFICGAGLVPWSIWRVSSRYGPFIDYWSEVRRKARETSFTCILDYWYQNGTNETNDSII